MLIQHQLRCRCFKTKNINELELKMKKIQQAIMKKMGLRIDNRGCGSRNETWWRWVLYHNI
jgi:hypothetical protein